MPVRGWRAIGVLGSIIVAALTLAPDARAQKRAAPKPARTPAPAPAPTQATPAPPTPAPAPATPATPDAATEAAKTEARRLFEKGLELLAEEAFDAAYVEFAASRKLYPTKAATKNAGMCLRRLRRFDEALDMFEALVREFPNLTAHDRALADKEIGTLRSLVGIVEVRGGAAGATLSIDGRERGTLPLAAPVRVSTGSHLVRAFKSGFAPFETRLEVPSGANVAVVIGLETLVRSGRLVVTEQAGHPAEVVVDNIVVGTAPWEGTVALGEHTVGLRSDGNLATQPALARVKENEQTRLTLAIEPLESTLRVEPTPVSGLVFIDGVPVGRGIWEGRLRGGPHKLEVVDEGFLPQITSVDLAKDGRTVKAIALERDMTSPMWRERVPSRFLLEARAGGALGVGFGGGVADCGGCDKGLLFGGLGRASLGYELGVGLGFTVDLGYAYARQTITGRTTTLRPLPVGSSPAEQGQADDHLVAQGATLGARIFFHRGSRLRWTLGVGGGLWLATVSDRRSGRFTTTVSVRPNGTPGQPATYDLPEVEQSSGAQFAYIAPELRVGLALAKHTELSLGVEAWAALALKAPRWDPLGSRVVTGTCRSGASSECVTDGLGVFDNDKLTGAAFFFLVPGVAIRHEL